MSLILRRSKTVCDVRPDSVNGDKSGKRKKGIFGKLIRSLSKFGRKKHFQSTSNLDGISKFASVAGSDSGVGSHGILIDSNLATQGLERETGQFLHFPFPSELVLRIPGRPDQF